ncbi:MAG: DegT/DnrJ/EryC1/StrS family aminotransferase [Saccharofermentanales bacterium]|jgi:pyridoxal phosphate-dependent aminotransferase EpsN|nr:DegT/DnrJ/EryC1/StrS family aminotransferase [Bacillota bacterium]
MSYDIYLSPPYMAGNERNYVKDAFDTNWIAPQGPHIKAFEKEVATYIDVNSSLALVSGTAAIHLALRYLGVQAGDYVFCQDFTFIGTCNPILYEKAIPVFIDSEEDTWNMSPLALENAFVWAKKNGIMPKAVIICDIYGEPADWDKLLPICRQYEVPVIEDAAEAMGSVYKGKKCGSFGDISILSFNGNKIITTSGGGMVLSSNKAAIAKMQFWSTQARESVAWYEHKEVGYNYRMSNICAAIGRGQLEILPQKLHRRLAIHKAYQKAIKGLPLYIKDDPEGGSNHWLNILCIRDKSISPEHIVASLKRAKIESRPSWKPMHMQPLFSNTTYVTQGDVFFIGKDAIGSDDSISEVIFDHSLCLPSGDALTPEQIEWIVFEIRSCL